MTKKDRELLLGGLVRRALKYMVELNGEKSPFSISIFRERVQKMSKLNEGLDSVFFA